MRTSKKRILTPITAAVCALLALAAVLPAAFGARGTRARAEEPEADVIRFEYRLPDEYIEGGAKQNDEYLFAFKLNTDYFEVRGLNVNSVLSYDVYSPCGIPGIGFYSAQDGTNWKWLTNGFYDVYPESGGMTDQNGVSAADTADLGAYLTNGWFNRRIKLNALPGNSMAHAVIGIHKPKDVVYSPDDLVDGNKIVVYYRNVIAKTGDAAQSASPAMSMIAGGIGAANFTEQQQSGDVLNGCLGFQTESPFSEGTTVKDTIKLSAVADTVFGVDPASVPVNGVEGVAMDFGAVKNTAGEPIANQDGFSVRVNGREITGGGTSYTPTEEDIGERSVVITYGAGDAKITYSYSATIAKGGRYTIKESDFAGIARSTDSMQTVILPKINAYVDGAQTVETTIAVSADGKPVALADGENGSKTFRPLSGGTAENDYKTTYSVRYTAVDPHDATNTAEYSFDVVSAWLKDPVIDVTELPLGKNEVGEYRVDVFGSVASLPATLVAHDYADGDAEATVEAKLVRVLDPFGDEIVLSEKDGNKEFRANISTDNKLGGRYRAVYEAVNAKGFKGTATAEIQVGHDPGMAIHWRVDTGKNEAGKTKATAVSLYGWLQDLYTFKSGDKLSYEMYVPSGTDGVMLDFKYEKTWNSMSTHVGTNGETLFTLADADGVPMNETPAAAKTGWVRREFALPSSILTDKNGDVTSNYVTHLLLTLDTQDAIETDVIDVWFRNIKIVGNTGLETVLYDGMHGLAPAHENSEANGYTKLQNQAYSAVDPLPGLDAAKFDERYGTAEDVVLPKDAYFDFYRNAALSDVTIAVKDPDGTAVTLGANASFRAVKAGKYTVTYTDNVSGAQAERQILVVDDTLPRAERTGDWSGKANVGDKIALPSYTLSDNITPADKLTVSYTVDRVEADGSKTRIEVKDGAFTADKVGEYEIQVVVRDLAGNRTEIIEKVTVSAKGGCAGCGGRIAGASALLGLGAIVVTAALLLRKKKV